MPRTDWLAAWPLGPSRLESKIIVVQYRFESAGAIAQASSVTAVNVPAATAAARRRPVSSR